MIGKNKVYSVVRTTIAELTGVEVYHLKGRSDKEVSAKWLFINTVYTLFYKTDLLAHLEKPYLYDISYLMGYSNDVGLYKLRYKYKPSDELIKLGEELIKYCSSKIKQYEEEI